MSVRTDGRVLFPARPGRRSGSNNRGVRGEAVIRFETSVCIERPIDDVFDYVSHPQTFPRWNSAVLTVHKTSAGEGDVGSTYSMERDLPSGRADNELEVVAHERPHEFAIRTTSGLTPFLYRYTFSPEDGGTIVQLDAEVELPAAVALVGPLARRAVKKGVDENLATLKSILEALAPGS
jgi:uncharacterized protein YndB with AHSA1/START domain